MSTSTVWEAYKGFYDHVLSKDHNNPELIGLWGRDPSRFETQILCYTDGTPIEGSNKYEEDGEIWGPMRWPYDAFTEEPHFNDPKITYFPSRRVKAIGTTWWDWKNKHTVRVGFDVDSIVGHAEGVGVDKSVIDQICRCDAPWLEIIRSTRGLGRHLYITFQEPFPVTVTHHEHAAIARSLLPMLSKATGVDMEASKDICGGVMWIHHVNANEENKGYGVLKSATESLTASDVPVNWRDHLSVICTNRSKVVVRGWSADGEVEGGDMLDQMTQERAKITLDETHERILDELEGTGYTYYWVHDHHLAQTHTGALLELYQKFEEQGTPLKGVFETISPGDDPGKPNCFMRPRINGGWDVYRFGEGEQEHEIWDHTGKHTHITFNVDFSLEKIAKICNGVEHPKADKGYFFSELCDIQRALKLLECDVELPARAEGRETYIRRRKDDDKLVLGIGKDRTDKPVDFKGFVKSSGGWERVLGNIDKGQDEVDVTANVDHKIRACSRRDFDDESTSGGSFTGWVVRDSNDRWIEIPAQHTKAYLKAQGIGDHETVIGSCIQNAWELVCMPFEEEFPGGRKWNRNAPQFRYKPADIAIDKKPHHPNWDLYLNHLGKDLDPYLKELDWSKEYGIENGGDYLKAWIACMMRFPYDKLPYLFMWSQMQETGKSLFHESISLLITRGVKAADRALTNDAGYNGELMNVVLAYIDEIDIATAGAAVYNKLKAWSTGLTLPIHAKYHQVVEAPNTLHFVQMANNLESLPVFQGDKRITAFEIYPVIAPIPKDVLMNSMTEEAPHFMRTLMDWPIPEAQSRLRLPVIETDTKSAAILHNEGDLAEFVKATCHKVNGHQIKLKLFCERYKTWCGEDDNKRSFDPRHVKNELRKLGINTGLSKDNQNYVANLTFDHEAEPNGKFVLHDNRLTLEK